MIVEKEIIALFYKSNNRTLWKTWYTNL